MSLDYNMSAVENYDELKTDDEMAKTSAMIWDTLATDIGHIKDYDTAVNFYARAIMFGGACLISTPLVYTLSDVVRRIGLRTNVSTTSDAAFHGKLRRTVKNQIRDLAYYRAKDDERKASIAE